MQVNQHDWSPRCSKNATTGVIRNLGEEHRGDWISSALR